MNQTQSFTIKVNNLLYIIKPYTENNNVLYEVFTNCEKLFTIKRNELGNWITDEKDIIPISEHLVADIGEELQQFQNEY